MDYAPFQNGMRSVVDTIRAMQYFVRAVELRSLSAVAREQGTQQPNVSKILRALEQHLGVRLFERSTTGLVATDQGMRFYERAIVVLEEYGNAVAHAQGLTEQPAGLLRVNAPVAFGQFRLNALVQRFLAQYPDIQIELILNDRFVDLVEEGVDIALRLGRMLPPNVVARAVAVSPRFLVAAPAYLERHEKLEHPEELAHHDYIRFAWTSTGDVIELQLGSRKVNVKTNGRYRVNNALAIRESLAMGSGIGLCPAWLIHDLLESGQLVKVLPDWTADPQPVSLLYPSRRYQPLRTKLFMDFVERSVIAMPGFEVGPRHID